MIVSFEGHVEGHEDVQLATIDPMLEVLVLFSKDIVPLIPEKLLDGNEVSIALDEFELLKEIAPLSDVKLNDEELKSVTAELLEPVSATG